VRRNLSAYDLTHGIRQSALIPQNVAIECEADPKTAQNDKDDDPDRDPAKSFGDFEASGVGLGDDENTAVG